MARHKIRDNNCFTVSIRILLQLHLNQDAQFLLNYSKLLANIWQDPRWRNLLTNLRRVEENDYNYSNTIYYFFLELFMPNCLLLVVIETSICKYLFCEKLLLFWELLDRIALKTVHMSLQNAGRMSLCRQKLTNQNAVSWLTYS